MQVMGLFLVPGREEKDRAHQRRSVQHSDQDRAAIATHDELMSANSKGVTRFLSATAASRT